jgi:hypothetical protein
MRRPSPAHRTAARTLLAVLVLPNLVLWSAASGLATERALINVDYLALGALSGALRRSVLIVAFIVLLLVDTILSLAPIFNFDPGDAFLVVRELRHLDHRTIALVLLGVAIIAAVARWIWPRAGLPLRRTTLLYGSLAVLVLIADSANGLGYFARRESVLLPINVATSAIYRAQRSFRSAAALRASGGSGDFARVQAASDSLRIGLEQGSFPAGFPAKIVVVIVESLGAFADAAAASVLRSRLQSDEILQRFHLRSGTVPFDGGTTNAEFRELCGVNRGYLSAPREYQHSCLPALLRAQGYETVAMHGYRGGLFGRRRWYPLLGFERVLFRSELRAAGTLPDCGLAFRGVCDSAFAGILAEELKRDPKQRQFLYWLTLGTHFPLDPRGGSNEVRCDQLGAAAAAGRCVYARGIWSVLDVVARLAEDPTLPLAWYVIVGDHPPPASNTGSGSFQPGHVAFFELIPRSPPPQREDIRAR